MTMIRMWKYIAIVMLAALAACTRFDEHGIVPADPEVPEGYERIRFTVDGLDMKEVGTRAVDIDGGGIQELRLFCFDRYGLFIITSRAKYELNPNSMSGGIFDAIIPQNTRLIHFIANQNMTNYPEDLFHGKSETEVLGLLEGSSGKMIYWGRVQAPTTTDASGNYTTSIKDYLNTKHTQDGRQASIWMIRNHALVQIKNNEANNAHFIVSGLAVYNSMAFGTVAPLYEGDFPSEWPGSVEYVTLPANRSKVSDVTSVRGATYPNTASEFFGQYIFECENLQEDPVSVILRGRNVVNGVASDQEMYYRVMLQKDNGDMLKLRRNHRYSINIKGNLNYGQTTFAAALEAPASNNIWISISDDIREVQNQSHILTVENTAYVLAAPTASSQKAKVFYNYVTTANAVATKPSVDWVGAQNVSENTAFTATSAHRYGSELTDQDREDMPAEGTYNGVIEITLSTMDGLQKREGTLLIKSGELQRKVKVMTIAQQNFDPAWASSQVYGSLSATDKSKRAHATLMFTIPETTPAELFPMEVRISTNKLDVRSASGQTLPVVARGADNFGDMTRTYVTEKLDADGKPVVGDDGKVVMETITEDCDYKYVLTVEKPGVQRVYFENILNETAKDNEFIFIEADFFQTIYKEVQFTTNTYSINIEQMASYNISKTDDEGIKFYLVPQKIHAPVNMSLVLHSGRKADNNLEAIAPNGNNVGTTTAKAYDEFLLYSQHLSAPKYYPGTTEGSFVGDNTFNGVGGFNPDVYIKPAREDFWSINGRVHLFWAHKFDSDTKAFDLNMYTDIARSAEPVRIASNESGKSYIDIDENDSSLDAGGPYYGKMFRTFVFELANYRPFRFAAQVAFNGGEYKGTWGTGETDEKAEEEEALTFTYEDVGTPVNLAFDVTSFHSNPWEGATQAGGSVTSVSVDPFGTAFDIYIDAPMLKLNPDSDLVKNGKLEASDDVPGRFVYHVSADRETERTTGLSTLQAAYKDNATVHWTNAAAGTVVEALKPNQAGERKVLPFLTNTIVTSGDISISSEESKVVFYQKNFKVSNAVETGKIYFGEGAIGEDGAPVEGAVYNHVAPGEFVVVQRNYDDTRLAAMTIVDPNSAVTGDEYYELRLRKEYAFSWSDLLELQYTSGQNVYSTKIILSDLCGDEGKNIYLQKEVED